MSVAANSRYRWVVLAVSVLVNITIQLQWIALSPVSTTAADYYGVSTTLIGYFSIVFMVVFIPLSIPAAWLVDRYGIRFAVGLGSLLVAVGGTIRFLAGTSYGLAMAGAIVVAAAQPLLFNAWTTVAGKWFPRQLRATVVSVLTLAMMVGVALGTAFTPALLDAGLAIDQVLGLYAVAAWVTGIAYCLFARDADHSIADASDARALELGGLRHAMAQRPFQVFLAALFVALGVFNGLSTWALQVVTAMGLPEDAAEILLECLLVGGVLGALALGAASDRTGRRVPWTAVPMIVAAPLMAAFVIPQESMWLLGACAFVVGFLLTGAMPVGMQYASEIAAPTPEGASSGLFQLVGQASFVVVLFMDAARTGDGGFVVGFAILGVLLAVIGVWMLRQPEPTLDVPIPGDLEADPAA
ncbi:MAG: MFS transporter [Propionicimonas sp.]|uniref:MFS transporter n=1 Tax=Propionicimonas sp. TaxID=1955623 RepID=UPI003D11F788